MKLNRYFLPLSAHFAIQNNSVTGDLDAIFCREENTQNVVSSDCDDPNPEVTCGCCTECCNDDWGCPYDSGLEACSRDLDSWLYQFYDCSCEPNTEIENVDYSMVCDATRNPISLCNPEGNDCAISSEGNHYSANGEVISFWQQYKYLSGKHKDKVIKYDATSPASCEVSVDGERCQQCYTTLCLDDSTKLVVDCGNIEEDAYFNGCASPDSDGLLRILYYWFDNARNFLPHPPGICSFTKQSLELTESPFLECNCSEDGILLTCQPDCQYCILTLNEESLESHEHCYVYEIAAHSSSDDTDEAETHNYQYVSSSDYNGTKVSLLQNQTSDSCSVWVDDKQCQSCQNTICDENPNGLRTVEANCTNLVDYGSPYFDACDQTTWTSSGVLQILQPPSSGCDYMDNIEFCSHQKVLFERRNPSYSCECNENGTRFSCSQQQDGDCQHCLPNGDCFAHEVVNEIDHELGGNGVRFVNNVYEYLSAPSPSSNSYGEGTVVSVSSNDDLCSAAIDGNPCKTCNYATCPGYDIPGAYDRALMSNMLQVDCSNLEDYGMPTFDACDQSSWQSNSSVLQVFQPLPTCSKQ